MRPNSQKADPFFRPQGASTDETARAVLHELPLVGAEMVNRSRFLIPASVDAPTKRLLTLSGFRIGFVAFPADIGMMCEYKD